MADENLEMQREDGEVSPGYAATKEARYLCTYAALLRFEPYTLRWRDSTSADHVWADLHLYTTGSM